MQTNRLAVKKTSEKRTHTKLSIKQNQQAHPDNHHLQSTKTTARSTRIVRLKLLNLPSLELRRLHIDLD